VLSIADDPAGLNRVETAFWRLAALSGDRLILPRTAEQCEASIAALAAAGIPAPPEGPALVAPVSGDRAALELVADAAADGVVWCSFGRVDLLTGSAARVEEHARRMSAAALSRNVITLSSIESAVWDGWPRDVRVRISGAFSAFIEAEGNATVLSRIA
jgi:hypothetical protein